MSLLGVDVGTSGCKACVFTEDGALLGQAYVEYDVQRNGSGWAELDAGLVWEGVKGTIREAAAAARVAAPGDRIRTVAVSSLGEATVPVTAERRILGPSMLNADARGGAYLESLGAAMPDEELYGINGNVLGNHYSLTKLMWMRDHRPEVYERADFFLHWASLVAFLLGGEAVVDYSLANRTLLFDVDAGGWSDRLLAWSGLDGGKLPPPAPSGAGIGAVSDAMADELGLPRGVTIAAGAHDQCANAVGCGVTGQGSAMFGMGTVLCIVPVFPERQPAGRMIPLGWNTEHHAAPGLFTSFLYNQGGCLVKWYRDTFAAAEHQAALAEGLDAIYPALFGELPEAPSRVLVLPHFEPTGPPRFLTDSCGVMAGLRLDVTRGEILKGLLEGSAYYLRECTEHLPEVGVHVDEFRVVGGGSRSDAWVSLLADIYGCPFVRPKVTEAGALGAAILGGVGGGVFSNAAEAAQAMVGTDRVFEPDPGRVAAHTERFALYRQLGPLLGAYLRGL